MNYLYYYDKIERKRCSKIKFIAKKYFEFNKKTIIYKMYLRKKLYFI